MRIKRLFLLDSRRFCLLLMLFRGFNFFLSFIMWLSWRLVFTLVVFYYHLLFLVLFLGILYLFRFFHFLCMFLKLIRGMRWHLIFAYRRCKLIIFIVYLWLLLWVHFRLFWSSSLCSMTSISFSTSIVLFKASSIIIKFIFFTLVSALSSVGWNSVIASFLVLLDTFYTLILLEVILIVKILNYSNTILVTCVGPYFGWRAGVQ